MITMHKYRVIVEWPSGRQYNAIVKSELDIEELQGEYADMAARREPLVFGQGSDSERATIIPFEGMMLVVMTEKGFEVAQARAEKQVEAAHRRRMQQQIEAARAAGIATPSLPIFMPK